MEVELYQPGSAVTFVVKRVLMACNFPELEIRGTFKNHVNP